MVIFDWLSWLHKGGLPRVRRIVDVEGRKIHSVGCVSDTAVRRLGWTTGRARGGAGASENDGLSGRGRRAAEARKTCHDGRRTVEAQERTERHARSPNL